MKNNCELILLYRNENDEFRFIENGKIKREESLAFIYLVALVIRNGMNILGVSLPEKM